MTDRRDERDNNRQRYPELAAFVDDCRKHFGEVRVVKLEPKNDQ